MVSVERADVMTQTSTTQTTSPQTAFYISPDRPMGNGDAHRPTQLAAATAKPLSSPLLYAAPAGTVMLHVDRLGIVPALCACYPGDAIEFSRTRARAHASYFWGFWRFFGEKSYFKKKIGPKMAQKWSKMAKITPKSATKIVGLPQEIPTNPKLDRFEL